MHGAENAFALLDARDDARSDDEYVSLARALETDGLLVLLPSSRFDARMRMFNPDGSEAEMCGNGIRCISRYLEERGGGARATIETLAGPIRTQIASRDPYEVQTEIGIPQVGAERELTAAGRTWRYTPVSLGNPHAVVFADDLHAIDLETSGAAIERHSDFPNRTNVHFVKPIDRSTLHVLHWERGAGATRACGTGIVASAAAAIVRGIAQTPVTVVVPGGTLTVKWDGSGGALLTGPVERTGSTEIALPVTTA
jgi:diaminopimelate epimerase